MSVRKPPFVQESVATHGSRDPSYIALHTTEGLGTIESYARYFRSTSAGLGSSFLVERSGRTGIYVARLTDKTYTQANQNSRCIGIEQSGFAATTRADWLSKHRRQLFATAWLCAWLCDQLGIPPILAGSERTGRAFTHSEGITQHRWLPLNDHTDCGSGYPTDFVAKFAAKWVKSGGPSLGTRLYIKTGIRTSK